MKRFVRMSGIVLGLLVILAMWTPAALAYTVTETKPKDLDIAGLVEFDSSIQANHVETITITLHSSENGYTIDTVTLKKSTPKGMGTMTLGTNTGWTISVTVTSNGDKTLHLWLWLTSGEHVGVNVHFPRA